jgi:uncharacterized protein (TIGR02145 family)
MKTRTLLLVVLVMSFVSTLSAQDIIYTVTGLFEDQKTSLDSIVVENLSNSKRLKFDNLPVLPDYQINLSKKSFWGTTSTHIIPQEEGLFVLQNFPGFITIGYRNDFATEARIGVYTVNGQKVHSAAKVYVSPGSPVQIHVGIAGVYLVRIETDYEVQTFRMIGHAGSGNISVASHGTAATQNSVTTKSGQVTGTTDFDYQPGDSIRVSVYKETYYARPLAFHIDKSERLNFNLVKSTVELIGVSDAYVHIDEQKTNIQAYDDSTGVVQIQFSGNKPQLNPGDIITVDVDTMGYLRKIVEVVDKDGIVILETEPASMNELFVDMEVKLHTALMEPNQQLKKGSTAREITNALTDENGYIHPVKVVYTDSEGKVIKKSALVGDDPIIGRQPIINESIDFSNTDLFGKKGENVHFYISEGNASVRVDAVFEMDFRYRGELDEDTKVKKSDLDYFLFYLDGKAEALTKLNLDMKYSYKKEEEGKKLKRIAKKVVQFYVGPVPVWITLNSDLYRSYWVDVDAKLNADWGFSTKHELEVGGRYERSTNTFTPHLKSEPTHEVFPLNVDGEINATAKLEIYPRTEVRFYGFFGPYAEIVPYLQGNYNAKLQSQIAPGFSETFLAWNSGIDVGLDLRVGTQLKFLFGMFDKSFGPEIINYINPTPLWQTPTDLTLLTTLPEEADAGTVIPLKFKVTDLWGLPQDLIAVYISGDGEFSKKLMITDMNGEVTVNWTLGSTEGKNELKAIIYKADKSVIKEITHAVNVKSGNTGPVAGTFTDTRDNRTYKTIKIGDQTWMAENLAYLPSVSLPTMNSATANIYYVYGFHDTDVAKAKQSSNYNTYGVLYNWPAAMAGAASSSTNPSYVQGVCPAGWHLPSDAEWTQLENHLADNGYNYDETIGGGRGKIAKSMAATTNWNSNSATGVIGNNLSHNNRSGFSALPGGLRVGSVFGWFDSIQVYGFWWSSTENSSSSAWRRYLGSNSVGIHRDGDTNKAGGYSVRCVRDESQQASLPTVSTAEVTSITENSATGGGNVTSDGGATVTVRGICWSTAPNPTTADSKTTDGTGAGSFTSDLTGLTANTMYYVRAYATNSVGIAYGNEIEFKTTVTTGPIYGSFTDSRDNRTYKTIKIGNQEWMAENLAYLPSVSPVSHGGVTAPFYYVYGYQGTDVTVAKQHANYETYGVIYNWPAAMAGNASSSATINEVQGVCPSGWHLPSNAEWTQLENYLISNGYNYDGTTNGNKIAKSIADTTKWNSHSSTGVIGNNLSLNNKSGFSALPGGIRGRRLNDAGFAYITFDAIGRIGWWWSSTEFSSTDAWFKALQNSGSAFGGAYIDKALGASVRCLRNESTQISLPKVTTTEITFIKQTTATGGGDVTNDGGAPITARGICWSTAPNPTIIDSNTTEGSGTGSFTSGITELTPNTTYYARAYATNSIGTAYGNQVEFITDVSTGPVYGSFTDPRDNKTYKTVKINHQEWMAENLAYLPAVSSASSGSSDYKHYYVYGYNGTDVNTAKATDNYKTYGVLYNWVAVMAGAGSSSANPSKVQGVCPAGWHLPSDAEWTQLENYLAGNGFNFDGTTGGGRNKIAKSMADTTKWNSHSGTGVIGNNLSLNNKSYFSALPGGSRGGLMYASGTFGGVGLYSNWWSSTERYSSSAWYRMLEYNGAGVYSNDYGKAAGFSVRCVKD